MRIYDANMTEIIEKELSYKIVRILFEVQNKLGSEYQEKYYQRAVSQALKEKNISFREQIPVDLNFKGLKIGKYILDFVINDKIVLEIKAVPYLKPIYFQQVRAYLKANQLRLGILANFRGDHLTYKRILFPIRTINSHNSDSHLFVGLARDSIEYFLNHHSVMETPPNLPNRLKTRAGVFVSLHNKSDGSLRGCIGTFLPTKKNLAQEIIYNAIAAAVEDPRFPPLTLEELAKIEISVDVLSPPKIVTQAISLDTRKYGLIVSTPDGRRGLLLPEIEGIDTVSEQERICRLKAGILPDESVIRHYFKVKRYQENK